MSVLRILNSRGDDEVSWTVEDKAAEQVAREKFLALADKGCAMFKVEGRDSEKIKSFDPTASEIIAVSPLVGG